MDADVIISTKLWFPVIVYYSISLLVFAVLFCIRIIIEKKNIRPLFMIYTLIVPAIAAIQFCIFYHGSKFIRDVLFISVNIDDYDSIIWGAAFFFLLYFLAMPRNKHAKFV